jgi:hypothetical protein
MVSVPLAVEVLVSPLISFMEAWVVQMSRGSFVPDTKAGAVDRVMRCIEQVTYMRGVFESNKPSLMLWIVMSLHFIIAAGIVAYPFVCSSAHDGIFLALAVLTMVQWVVMKGECGISYIEKRLYYKDYHMGDAPIHQWWSDLLPLQYVLFIGWFFVMGWTLSLGLTLLRNVTIRNDGCALVLRFGGSRAMSVGITITS